MYGLKKNHAFELNEQYRRWEIFQNHVSLASEAHIYFTKTWLTYTSLYITTFITKTIHTNIHSLEHSTTEDALAQIKLNFTTLTNWRITFLIVPSLGRICLFTLDVEVTWTTFNSKPTHSNTYTTLLSWLMPFLQNFPSGFLAGI